jgi:hypothetical protein
MGLRPWLQHAAASRLIAIASRLFAANRNRFAANRNLVLAMLQNSNSSAIFSTSYLSNKAQSFLGELRNAAFLYFFPVPRVLSGGDPREVSENLFY